MASYRYYKIQFTAGSGGAIMIGELELLSGSVDLTQGKTASASGAYSAAYAASKAIDDSTDTHWQNNAAYPHWLEVDLGTAQAISSYSVRASTQPVYTPSAWVLYGSNDRASWAQVHAKSDQTGWTSKERRVFAWSVISGVLTDDAGAPAVRAVRVYRRDTGGILASSVSNEAGFYSVSLDFVGEVQRIVLDDDAGDLHNDLIDRVVTA